MPPGSSPQDRYAPTDDSSEPPWRQTSFFGIRARGQFFIYVLDQSGSMLDDDRLTRAKIELRKSVYALQPPQRFEVIFYNDEATPMPGGPLPRPADQATKNQLTTWLHLIEPDGETNPRSALAMALAPPSRCRLPAFRRRVPQGDRRGRRQAQPPQDPDPLHRPDRRPGRRPPRPHRPRQRRPLRLTAGKPSGDTLSRPLTGLVAVRLVEQDRPCETIT